ncbi:LuxR C-terminal-related transcriptional regulator [Sphaerisporangium sp. NPDC049002]|uniref:response regulator transcription factor n=1 Tax=unclassified Sphaerisporangium TaxID=2630420 RepID=UPI0033E7805D
MHVSAGGAAARNRVLSLLGPCGFPLAPEPDGSADTVVIAAAATVDEALEAWSGAGGPGGHAVLLLADTFSPSGVMRAVRAGARTMLRSADATSVRLGAAVRSAHRGDGRLPHEVLVRLLGGPAPAPPRPAPPLTVRQKAVLALMADGLGNAAIAQVLCCSEHTVKNVIYDLTARLQVRNRAHAVACAVRRGLV